MRKPPRVRLKNIYYMNIKLQSLSIKKREYKSLENDESLFFFWIIIVGDGDFLL